MSEKLVCWTRTDNCFFYYVLFVPRLIKYNKKQNKNKTKPEKEKNKYNSIQLFRSFWNVSKIISGSLTHTAQKWSFQLRISSVNMTKFAVSSGVGHIYWGNRQWKTSFFVQCNFVIMCSESALYLNHFVY